MKYPWPIWIPRMIVIALILFAVVASVMGFSVEIPLEAQLRIYIVRFAPVLALYLVLNLTWKNAFCAGSAIGLVASATAIMFALVQVGEFWVEFLLFGVPLLVSSGLFFLIHFQSEADKRGIGESLGRLA